MTEQNGRAEILRAAGFGDAADLLERLDAIDAAKSTADEVEQSRPDPQRRSPIADAEAERRAEGEVLLAALRESIPGIYDR